MDTENLGPGKVCTIERVSENPLLEVPLYDDSLSIPNSL